MAPHGLFSLAHAVRRLFIEWDFIGITINNSFILAEIDIFKENWENTGEVAYVIDPAYRQQFSFTVWKVKRDGKDIIFAAGEFSNNVFAIYTKKK